MKMYKFSVMAFAALAFASCGNDDPNPGEEKKEEGALVETLKVSFVDSKNTYASQPDEDGIGTENSVYHAFVFAKEASPGHTGPLPGDWTVQEVTVDGTTALPEGTPNDESGVNSTLKNAATFKGVRMGDNVYVIANMPEDEFNLTAAQVLAHNGVGSEDAIKAFIQNIDKKYLNGLAYRSHKKDGAEGVPTGKYIMAGVGTIPSNPTIQNGTTVTVPVSLDRELAKVFFQATVTQDIKYPAFGKMELKDTDGFIVVRTSPRVSPFTKQTTGWYLPTTFTNEEYDWDMATWKTVFDGRAYLTPPAVAGADGEVFNNNRFQANAKTSKEFCFSYLSSKTNHTSGSGFTDGTLVSTVTTPEAYLENGFVKSPWFYVTPNYSDNTGCATMICTQATYKGNTVLIDKVSQEMIDLALADVTLGAKIGENKTIDGVVQKVLKADAWDAEQNILDFLAFIQANATYKTVLPADKYPNAASVIECEDGDKRYYRADIADYDVDNTTSLKNTERNTIYRLRATITTLGAKTIEDAIKSDDISMLVQVQVNPWKVKFNNINM